ncbi:MAG: methionyl-tRNA formyltransferase [Clostridia bacterium]|nr:methionyl-tRNA formyltransferase [Clostridia bacterium]
MKIVFFGTSQFAVPIIEGILNTENDLCAIVCQPDQINQRNNKIEYSPVKKFALKNNIPLFQFRRLNKEGEQILKDLAPDIIITASYGQIIRKNILEIPKYGIYNVHGSLLPKYRGPAPIQWSIIKGETQTGITIMKTEEGIDCGEIYIQTVCRINENDTSSSMFDKLSTLGKDVIINFLNNFEYYIKNGKKQNDAESTYFPMIKKEDAQIKFDNNSKDIVNMIRGYDLLGAFFFYKNVRYKVLSAKVCDKAIEIMPSGSILCAKSKMGLYIASKDGAVEILKIQPENKKIMDIKDFLNGTKFEVGEKIEYIS